MRNNTPRKKSLLKIFFENHEKKARERRKHSVTYEQREAAAKEGNLIFSVSIAIIGWYLGSYISSLMMNGYMLNEAISIVFDNFSNSRYLFDVSFKVLLDGLAFGVFTGGIAYFVMSIEHRRHFTYEQGKSQGDARPMSRQELLDYTKEYVEEESEDDSLPKNNIILCLEMKRPIDGKVIGNNNVFVIGGAGSGKSFAYVKTNIMQMYGSYIVTDPSGELIYATGKMLSEHGYKIKVFNISDMGHSNCYNPLKYIRNEAGVMMVVEMLIKNTSMEGSKDDQFFVSAEKLLYSACIFYLLEFCADESKKNLPTVMNMINMSRVNENDAFEESPLDMLFKPIPQSSMAAKYYKSFKQAAGKTLKSIIISCVARLQPFMIPQVISLTSTDEMELEKLGNEKTALFIVTPQADRTYAFLASMLYSQMFETLYAVAEKKLQETGSGKLEIPVMALMDEFANIGEVPEFPGKLATMRKYNISASVILQDLAQLKAMYDKKWASIISNCSSWLFLGATEQETLEYFSKRTGNRTIRVRSSGVSHGRNKSASLNYQESSRAVLTEDELSRLRPDECVVYTQNLRPVIGHKYFANKHPRYNQTGSKDYPNNNFRYTEMPAYDTGRLKTNSLLRSKSEAARVRMESKISDPVKAADVRFDGSLKDTSNFFKMSQTVDESAYQSKYDQCLEAYVQSMEEGNAVPFLKIEHVPQNKLFRLANDISGTLQIDHFILFCFNPDISKKNLFGICIDKGKEGLLESAKLAHPKSYQLIQNGNVSYAEIEILESKYADYKNRVQMFYLSQASPGGNITEAVNHQEEVDSDKEPPTSIKNAGGIGQGSLDNEIDPPAKEPEYSVIADPDLDEENEGIAW